MRRRMLLPQSEMYLTIISATDNNTIGWKCSDASIAKTIQISTDDGVSWTAVTSTTSGATLATLNKDEKMLIKGNNVAYGSGTDDTSLYNSFTSTDAFDVIGNIMSLIYGDNFVGQNQYTSANVLNGLFRESGVRKAEHLILPNTTIRYCYYYMFQNCVSLISAPALPALSAATCACNGMFYGCTSLVEAPDLPAINVGQRPFQSMFEGCTSLVKAPSVIFVSTYYCCYRMFYGCVSLHNPPALPSTALRGTNCYGYMFYGCSSLEISPVLPATVLTNNCYNQMFFGCSSLLEAPELPATTLTQYCYYQMFYGCSALVHPPKLPATILAEYCYYYMFYGCSSLIEAPNLPATTMEYRSYRGMFRDCTSLVTVQNILPATTLAEYCYSDMFRGCTSLTTAPELPATVLANYCYQYMFSGCTALTTAPELPAAILTTSCYSNMFNSCSRITSIKCLATDVTATNCRSSWLYRVSGSGTFIKHPSMNSWPRGISGIPNNWTILEAVQITVTYTSGNSGAYLKEIGTNDVIHTFIDGEPYEAELDDTKTYGVYDSNDNLVETLATPFNRLNSITI